VLNKIMVASATYMYDFNILIVPTVCINIRAVNSSTSLLDRFVRNIYSMLRAAHIDSRVLLICGSI